MKNKNIYKYRCIHKYDYKSYHLTAITFKVLAWLSKCLQTNANLEEPVQLGVFIPFLNSLRKIKNSRGEIGLIAYLKDLRLAYLSYLGDISSHKYQVKLSNGGLPVVLAPIHIEDSKIHERLILTILYMTRAVKLEAKLDVSSIVDTSLKTEEHTTAHPKKF